MSDFAPPSFSLGLDFEVDSQPQTFVRENPQHKPAGQPSTSAQIPDLRDDDFESLYPVPDPPRAFKRLRRGLSNTPALDFCPKNVDDDIEDFSSPEDHRRDGPPIPLKQNHSVCSSSKFSLPGHGILTTQSAREKNQVSNAAASSNLETSRNNFMFPKLTVSPLRRFQLIESDSDSDDPSNINREANKSNSSSKERQSNHGVHASSREQMRTQDSVSKSQIEDLWSDFCPVKNVRIPTPALDEVCNEYFSSMKDKNKFQKNTKGCVPSNNVSKNFEQQLNLGDPIPPALRYFFHDDPRIQELVRSRLPNFFPLGELNNRGYNQPNASVIDYMGQFNQGQGSKKSAVKNNSEIRSTRRRKKSNVEEVAQGSGWVNPRSGAAIPKDAGKRRVHAVGQSAGGHWYTNTNGKRVFVTKDGKELTGRDAYRHYKKASGGFKRSKKKTGAKKK